MPASPTERHRRMFARAAQQQTKVPILRNEDPPADKPDEAETVAKLYLYDVIDSWGGYWGVSAREFVDVLAGLDDDIETIELHINSPGGEVFEGIAILNALRQHDARVVTVVDGLAASAASFIAAGGDDFVMGRNSELMIHDAWAICVGNAADMRDTAKKLDSFCDNIASIYAEAAGGEVADWRKVMRAETWYTADEAVAAGLADRVDGVADDDAEDDISAKDRFDLSVFNYAGRAEAPAPHLPSRKGGNPKPPTASADGSITTQEGSSAVEFSDEQITTMRQELGLPEDADEATIVAALHEALEERTTEPPAAATIPEGHVVVPEARLTDLEAAANRGSDAADRMHENERESFLDSVVTKFLPANRQAWRDEYDRDPKATRAHFEKAPTLVSVDPIGHDQNTSDADDAYLALYGEKKGA